MITKLLFETRAGDRILALIERITRRAIVVDGRVRLVPLAALEG